MRGDVYELKRDKAAKGHEQRGARYCIIVQADHLPLSTVLVVPTSTQAQPAEFRPEILVRNNHTRALAEQAGAIDLSRLGDHVGRLLPEEIEAIDEALLAILGLSL